MEGKAGATSQAAAAGAPSTGPCVRDLPLVSPVTVGPEQPLPEAVLLMKQHGFDQIPVCSSGADGNLEMCGLLRLHELSKRVKSTGDSGSPLAEKSCGDSATAALAEVTADTPLSQAQDLFRGDCSAIMVVETVNGKKVLRSVLTEIDIISYQLDQTLSTSFPGEGGPSRSPVRGRNAHP